MYCPQCGSQMDDGWVACPRCGHKWEDGQARPLMPESSFQRTGLYPNKRQWWVIWIAAGLIVAGLLAGSNGIMFALSAALIGALLVWKFQKP
jgi:uncharacterized membrane protein YvbJ